MPDLPEPEGSVLKNHLKQVSVTLFVTATFCCTFATSTLHECYTDTGSCHSRSGLESYLFHACDYVREADFIVVRYDERRWQSWLRNLVAEAATVLSLGFQITWLAKKQCRLLMDVCRFVRNKWVIFVGLHWSPVQLWCACWWCERVVCVHGVVILDAFVMVALWNRADHYIFILSFVLLLLSSFFPSPNLSRRRLDVCHTFTHDVALVRI